MTDIRRRFSVEFPDGDDGRLYETTDGSLYPSVTTITSRRDDPRKDAAIDGWKDKHDGSGDNAHWKDIYWYSGPRGTIIHWYILCHLTDGLGGDEERDALSSIKANAHNYERVSSIVANHEGDLGLPDENEYHAQLRDDDDPLSLTDVLVRDAGWALEAFCDCTPQLGVSDVGYAESDCRTTVEFFETHVNMEHVRGVENFIVGSLGYAGQYDLLYDRPDGTTVLCDLKTSSGVYWGHKRQAEAYARAIDATVDELEIVRLQPDKRETEISRSSEWDESRQSLWADFKRLHSKTMTLVNAMDLDQHRRSADGGVAA